MMRVLKTSALIVIAALVLAVVADAQESPNREEYVARVEPICQANTIANHRILKGVRNEVKHHKLATAGRQFIRAAEAFGATVKQIAAVPRPPGDAERLTTWLGFLGIVRTDLGKLGKALVKGDRVTANHELLGVERSSNAANNVSFAFGFHYCRIEPSRFS